MIYTLKIMAAVAGGFVGLSLVLHNKPITRYRVITESLATAIFSAALVDKYFLSQNAVVCSFFGLIVGFLNGYFLDMLKSIAPKLVRFSFKAWFARAFGFELPSDVIDDTQPEKPHGEILDESRDREAVEWLENPPPPPPQPIKQYIKK